MNISTYLMQSHGPSKENLKRWNQIMESTSRIDTDGLKNIENISKILSVEEFPKFTRIRTYVSFNYTQ
jgi:hypothetical protein